MPRKWLGCLLVSLSTLVSIRAPAHAQGVAAASWSTGPIPPPADGAAASSITPDSAVVPETAPPAYDSRAQTARPASPPAITGPAPPVPQVPSSQAADRESPGTKSHQLTPLPTTPASYSGQIVLGDLLGLALTVVLLNTGSGLAALPYFAASPVVHGVHGNPGRAVEGLLLHLTVPVAGLLLGLAIDRSSCSSDGEDFCGLAGAGIGFLGGLIAATAIDAAVLARDAPVSSSTSPSSQPILIPTVSMPRAGGGALAGIAGRF